ncbi:hypothetical protein [Alicyclobacillus sp. ALC3]|uniref:hypothetical protein n=1 Tax=Alicyclobacillus sp. ALC3 TaxID=2796143 RepID=UPI002379BCCD|nr:hypothetical protein [Alicyclobacillus sp. ALC3]WDL98593.1 hypothetical protein JC200_07970 [Alicyclobacillus sp. ALC3]
MFTVILIISLVMMIYGAARTAYEDYKRHQHVGVHALWIPGGALFFALGVWAYGWL